jgi:hypothetical protein
MRLVRRKARSLAPPILPEQLHAMVAALPHTVAGMRDQFILVVGWWMTARRSELVRDHRPLRQSQPDATTMTSASGGQQAQKEIDGHRCASTGLHGRREGRRCMHLHLVLPCRIVGLAQPTFREWCEDGTGVGRQGRLISPAE